MESLGVLESLKTFLADRPEVAFLAVSLLVNATLFAFYVRARDAHVTSLMSILPLATRLSDLLALAATRAKARNNHPEATSEGLYRPPDSGISEKE